MLLINAVRGGRIAQVQMFIKVGIDVNEVDESGHTGLIHCCFLQESRTMLKILKALALAGADINKKDSFGRTVLAWACLKGRFEVVRFLLNDPHCVDVRVDVTDKDGNSTLLLAVMSGNFLVVKMMVGVLKGTARPSELNKSNNAGMRPLIAAFLRGDKLCAQFLVKQIGSSVASVLKYLRSLQHGSNEFRTSSSNVPLFDSSRSKRKTRNDFIKVTEDNIFEFLFAEDKYQSDMQKCESQEPRDKKESAGEEDQDGNRSGWKQQDSSLFVRPLSSRTIPDNFEVVSLSYAGKNASGAFTREPVMRKNETKSATSCRTSVQKLMILYAEQNSPSFRQGLPIPRYIPPRSQDFNTEAGGKFDSRLSSLHPGELDSVGGLSPRLLRESLVDHQLRLKYARNSRATSMQVPRLPSVSGMGRVKRTRSSTTFAMKL